MEEVCGRLAEGYSFSDISRWLSSMDKPVSPPAVARYARSWTEIAEEVRIAKEQARVFVRELQERPNSDLAEAVEQMLLTLVSNALAECRIELSKADPVKIGNMVANLQRAGLQRDKLKLELMREYEKQKQDTVNRVSKTAKEKGLDPETAEAIRKDILGL